MCNEWIHLYIYIDTHTTPFSYCYVYPSYWTCTYIHETILTPIYGHVNRQQHVYNVCSMSGCQTSSSGPGVGLGAAKREPPCPWVRSTGGLALTTCPHQFQWSLFQGPGRELLRSMCQTNNTTTFTAHVSWPGVVVVHQFTPHLVLSNVPQYHTLLPNGLIFKSCQMSKMSININNAKATQ